MLRGPHSTPERPGTANTTAVIVFSENSLFSKEVLRRLRYRELFPSLTLGSLAVTAFEEMLGVNVCLIVGAGALIRVGL
jgi:hypothetical protein